MSIQNLSYPAIITLFLSTPSTKLDDELKGCLKAKCFIHLSGPNGTHFIPVLGLYCLGPLYGTALGPQLTFKDNDEKLVTQKPFVFIVGM